MAQRPDDREFQPHSSHWGAFSAGMRDGRLVVLPHPGDPDPNRHHREFPRRVAPPARASPSRWSAAAGSRTAPARTIGAAATSSSRWHGTQALDLLATELARVRDAHGPGAVFGGSYGWSSAGRFHHAQSQVHRFLNIALGGYVRSVNTYSSGAASVLLPHIIGDYEAVTKRNVILGADRRA